MKYNTAYKCKYTEEIEATNLEDLRDMLYRDDLLNIFDTNDFSIFNVNIPELHCKLVCNNGLKECMKKAAASLLSEDTELGLCILYSYDFMYLTHICVSEYLTSGVISQENLDSLSSQLDVVLKK